MFHIYYIFSVVYKNVKGQAGTRCHWNSDCNSNYCMPMENIEEGGTLTWECV